MTSTLALAVLAALTIAGCGSTDTSTPDDDEPVAAQTEEAPAATCKPVKKDTATALNAGLTADGDARLRRFRQVALTLEDASMATFADGAHVIAAELVADGVDAGTTLAWIASDDDSLILPLDAVTREFNEFGTGANEDSPARAVADAADETSEADQARDCAAG
jgi:hypothetical protein